MEILQIPHTALPELFPDLEEFLVLEDKSHDEIDNNGRAEGEKREVDKIHAHIGGFDAELFAPPLANPEGLLLEPHAYARYHIILFF
jgi:hypothetical protein